MDPVNAPAGQPKKNPLPTILANSEWAKGAEYCSCNDPQRKVEPVTFVCMEQGCPNHES